MKRALACAALAAAMAAFAEDGWETAVSEPNLTIQTRKQEGSAVREVLAEGEIDAPPADAAAAWMDVDGYPRFMPYVKAARVLDKPDGGVRVVYNELSFPICAGRDFVVADRVEKTLEKDGVFVNSWSALNDRLPERANVVRVKLNTGSVRISPADGGARSHLVYRFSVDPGGYIPAWMADLGNKSAVPEAFKAVEKEAKRRRDEREAPDRVQLRPAR